MAVATTISAGELSPSPYPAKAGAGRGMSFANFLRFWAVAANRKLVFGPARSAQAPLAEPTMRLRWATSISTFFR
jgi:hypothetical protein